LILGFGMFKSLSFMFLHSLFMGNSLQFINKLSSLQ
jgi:hypothetical protein